jgi:hypothetical protein
VAEWAAGAGLGPVVLVGHSSGTQVAARAGGGRRRGGGTSTSARRTVSAVSSAQPGTFGGGWNFAEHTRAAASRAASVGSAWEVSAPTSARRAGRRCRGPAPRSSGPRADVGRSRPPPPGPRHKPRAPAGPPVRRRIRPAVRARRRAGSPAWHTGWPRGGVGGEHRPMEEIGDDVATSNPSPSPLPSSPSPSPPLRAQTGSAPAPPPGWAWPEPDHRPSPTSGATPRSPPPTPPGSIDTCSTRPTPKGGLGGAGSGVPPSVAPEHKARRGPTRQ